MKIAKLSFLVLDFICVERVRVYDENMQEKQAKNSYKISIFNSLPFHLHKRTQNEGFNVYTEGKNILDRKYHGKSEERDFAFFRWLPRPIWRRRE